MEMEIREVEDAEGKLVSSSVQSLESMRKESTEALKTLSAKLKVKLEEKAKQEGTEETKLEDAKPGLFFGSAADAVPAEAVMHAAAAAAEDANEEEEAETDEDETKEETSSPPPPSSAVTQEDRERRWFEKSKFGSFEEMMRRVSELEALEAEADRRVVEARRNPKKWSRGFLGQKKKVGPTLDEFTPAVEDADLQRPNPLSIGVTKQVTFIERPTPTQRNEEKVCRPAVASNGLVGRVAERPPVAGNGLVGRVAERPPRRRAGPPQVDIPGQLNDENRAQPSSVVNTSLSDELFDDPDAVDDPPDVSRFRARRMRGHPDLY